jgi:hypothetical protein
MQPHQRRILGRIADEIDGYRDGRRTMWQLLNNTWGLFEAAELRDSETRGRFTDLYLALSIQDDAGQPWMPADLGSDEALRAALRDLENWATAIRDRDPGGTAEDD